MRGSENRERSVSGDERRVSCAAAGRAPYRFGRMVGRVVRRLAIPADDGPDQRGGEILSHKYGVREIPQAGCRSRRWCYAAYNTPVGEFVQAGRVNDDR